MIFFANPKYSEPLYVSFIAINIAGGYITAVCGPRQLYRDSKRMAPLGIRATLLALYALLSSDVMAVALPAPAHFYPYGPDVGDETVPVNDDGSTGVIQIATKFPYFDDIHDSLYVSTFVRIQLWCK